MSEKQRHSYCERCPQYDTCPHNHIVPDCWKADDLAWENSKKEVETEH